jgi:hypothetical protein
MNIFLSPLKTNRESLAGLENQFGQRAILVLGDHRDNAVFAKDGRENRLLLE